MSWYSGYKLVQDGEKNIVEIYLNPDDTEFASEFLSEVKENVLKFEDEIQSLVKEKFADVKVDAVKLLLGAMVVGTIPFMHATTAKAADISPTTTTATTTTAAVTTGTLTGTTTTQPATSPTTTQTATAPAYTVSPLNTTGTVISSLLNMRLGPSTSYAVMHQLYYGNMVHVIGSANGWYQIQLSDGRIGFVSGTYLRLEAPTIQQQTDLTMTIAKSYLGTPYVWGGNSPASGGFDCSGFTQYVFGRVGYNLNRISRDQALQGAYVSYSTLQPGDLVFFSMAGDGNISHVGIYTGNGQMIHSPKTGDVVRITDITTWFWQSHYVTARRIIGVLPQS